jgi:hypothetical protein
MTETIVQHPYYPAIFVARIINWIVGIIEILLGLRLLLELFGADTASPFVTWVYSITMTILTPFSGAFPSLSLGGSSVIDLVTLIAMIGYAVLGWILTEVLSLIFVSMVRM